MALPELLRDEECVIDVPAGASEVSLPSGTRRFRLRFYEHCSLGSVEITGELTVSGTMILNRVQFGKRIDTSISFRTRWRDG